MLDENFEFGQGAYFYKKSDKPLSKNALEDLYRVVTADRVSGSKNYYKVIKKPLPGGKEGEYTLFVFKKLVQPDFFVDLVENETEVKYCYLLLFEYKDFVVISKKNIGSLGSLSKYIDIIDYSTILKLYSNDDTHFHKLSLSNLDVSDTAIRNKAVDAQNLEGSFSTFGANNYAIKSMRVSLGSDKYSLMMSTARVGQYGTRRETAEICAWMTGVCENIVNVVSEQSFVDAFAEPLNFKKEIKRLKPNGLLFRLGSIIDDLDSGKIKKPLYSVGRRDLPLDLLELMQNYQQVFDICERGNISELQLDKNQSIKGKLKVELKILTSSMKVSSDLLRRVSFEVQGGERETLENYLNNNSGFVVTFDDPQVAYSSNSLFRNSALLGNIEAFMDVFEHYTALGGVKSEKGKLKIGDTHFHEESVFCQVEKVIAAESTYLFLDDLGHEWADHIGVSNGKIVFYISKFGKTARSATAFQDVVGQAQKNLGNLTPPLSSLKKKEEKWGRLYKGVNVNKKIKSGVQTEIRHLRKFPCIKITGQKVVVKKASSRLLKYYRVRDDVKKALLYYEEQLKKPNLKKEVCLVVNFISKKDLRTWLLAIKNKEPVSNRNEILQILWILSSLVSSCKEQGVAIKIACKE